MEDDEKKYVKEDEQDESGHILGERPDYYVRRSKRACWMRYVLFPLVCIAVAFAIYRFVRFINNVEQLPDMGDEPSSQVSYALGQGESGKEGEVAQRLAKIYDDMLGDSRLHPLTYLSSDFRQVMMDVLNAERECGCTLLDHDLWTRTTGSDHDMQIKSVTVATDDRASGEVMVKGKLGHYSNQETIVVMLFLENGQWMVDDMLTSYGSEKGMLRQKAEEVLSTLSEQERLERREDVRHDAPVHTLSLRGVLEERNLVNFDMYLTISEGSVKGECEIEGDGARYILTGEIDGDGAMVLREYKNGVFSGRFFEGRMEGNSYVGKYRNSLGTTSSDFKATLR